MLRSVIAISLLSLLASAGCCVDRHATCGRSGGCGHAVDPILGDCTKCGVCGGTDCPGYTPCGYLKYMLTCGSGCSGDLYYNEWISDPPDCCDPCDNCGNWCEGGGCCRRRPIWHGLQALWGRRYCPSCGEYGPSYGESGGGCASCMRGHGGWSPIPMQDETEATIDEKIESIPGRETVPGRKSSPETSPHPARRPVPSTPEHKAERPSRSRPVTLKRASYEDPSLR